MARSSPTIEIFRAGAHTAMGGQTIAFSEADLAASAAAYDPALHEAPLVVGHPSHDGPAYGWVAGLAAKDGALAAEAAQIDPAFAEMVGAGRFKKISAAFYAPTAKANPAPGVYYLRHVGFLGAQAPAVKGLKQVEFADGEEGVVTIEFAEARPWMWRQIGEMFRGLRDWLIEEKGLEAADAVLPPWTVNNVMSEATLLEEAANDRRPAFSETPAILTKETIVPDPKTPSADAKAEEAKLAADRAKLDKDMAAFAEARAADIKVKNEAFLDQTIKEGRFPGGLRGVALQFMERLDAAETVEFGEGDGKAKRTELEQFQELLKAYPPMVEFGEAAKPDDADATVSFAAPPGFAVDAEQLAIHAKAQAYQAKNPGADYMTAVRAVAK